MKAGEFFAGRAEPAIGVTPARISRCTHRTECPTKVLSKEAVLVAWHVPSPSRCDFCDCLGEARDLRRPGAAAPTVPVDPWLSGQFRTVESRSARDLAAVPRATGFSPGSRGIPTLGMTIYGRRSRRCVPSCHSMSKKVRRMRRRGNGVELADEAAKSLCEYINERDATIARQETRAAGIIRGLGWSVQPERGRHRFPRAIPLSPTSPASPLRIPHPSNRCRPKWFCCSRIWQTRFRPRSDARSLRSGTIP